MGQFGWPLHGSASHSRGLSSGGPLRLLLFPGFPGFSRGLIFANLVVATKRAPDPRRNAGRVCARIGDEHSGRPGRCQAPASRGLTTPWSRSRGSDGSQRPSDSSWKRKRRDLEQGRGVPELSNCRNSIPRGASSGLPWKGWRYRTRPSFRSGGGRGLFRPSLPWRRPR